MIGRPVAGMLLTGGTSRRMGRDKADLVAEGERLADRTARVLAEACAPVLEVGPARSRLESVLEDPPGGGPLVAVAAGRRALLERSYAGPALVLAVDMAAVERSMRALLHEAGDLQWAGPRMWGAVADDRAFLDLDTPADLERLREGTRDVER